MLRRAVTLLLTVLILISVTPARAAEIADPVNRYRPDRPLPERADLGLYAEAWAATMASRGQISHSPLTLPGGWVHAGENVGTGPSVAAVLEAFAASPPHTAVLQADWSAYGFAAVFLNDAWWVTEVFVKDPPARRKGRYVRAVCTNRRRSRAWPRRRACRTARRPRRRPATR